MNHVFWAVCLVAVEVCATPQSDANPAGTPVQVGRIQGKVTDAVTDQGLRKSYVRLRGLDSATTDDEGSYVFENVKPGSYVIEAEHRGYIDGQFGEADEQTIQLAPGQLLKEINVKLTPQAVLSGRVVDEDGDPWTNATVNVFRSVWQRGGRRLQGFSGGECNDRGEFRVGMIPPGKYYLVAEPDSGWEMKNRGGGKLQSTREPTWRPNGL